MSGVKAEDKVCVSKNCLQFGFAVLLLYRATSHVTTEEWDVFRLSKGEEKGETLFTKLSVFKTQLALL